MFRCNLSPALLAEYPESFACHSGNTGVERTLYQSQHTKLTLEKKILQPLLTGFELAIMSLSILLTSYPSYSTDTLFLEFVEIQDYPFHLSEQTDVHMKNNWELQLFFFPMLSLESFEYKLEYSPLCTMPR